MAFLSPFSAGIKITTRTTLWSFQKCYRKNHRTRTTFGQGWITFCMQYKRILRSNFGKVLYYYYFFKKIQFFVNFVLRNFLTKKCKVWDLSRNICLTGWSFYKVQTIFYDYFQFPAVIEFKIRLAIVKNCLKLFEIAKNWLELFLVKSTLKTFGIA